MQNFPAKLSFSLDLQNTFITYKRNIDNSKKSLWPFPQKSGVTNTIKLMQAPYSIFCCNFNTHPHFFYYILKSGNLKNDGLVLWNNRSDIERFHVVYTWISPRLIVGFNLFWSRAADLRVFSKSSCGKLHMKNKNKIYASFTNT